MTELAPPPRTVKPRSRSYKRHTVIAVHGGIWLDENGETGSTADFTTKLPQMDSTLFAKTSAADFVADLDEYFSEWFDNWQWRASIAERDIRRGDDLRAVRMSVVIHYFGFKGGNYHKIIDPVAMYGRGLDEIWSNQGGSHDAPELNSGNGGGGDHPSAVCVRLLQWGICLRDFCHKNGLEVRPTMGGISAQFLTDRRFYPKKRRKVPMAINERAREHLPGNHYALFTQPSSTREFSAWYLDQHRAHHYHARTVALPDSDNLFAYGTFMNLSGVAFDRTIKDFYGLYCVDIQLPQRYRRSNWIRTTDRVFVFSNELQYMLDIGYVVNGVYAAWGSRRRDTGLARYARWAEKQLDHYGDNPWIKPLLLSTYGTLATRPRYGETIFKLAKAGEPVTLVTGNKELDGLLVRTGKKLEPRIANVIHRGMIEAATRLDSIGLAQWLNSEGYRVLSIYADAVIVEREGDKALPILPEPWRCKRELNHLRYINQQAFISGEMTKLPGVGRETLKYTAMLNGARPANQLKSLAQLRDERYDYTHGNVR